MESTFHRHNTTISERSRARMSTPCSRILLGMQRAEEIAPLVPEFDPHRRHER